jgi:hypothetical protein
MYNSLGRWIAKNPSIPLGVSAKAWFNEVSIPFTFNEPDPPSGPSVKKTKVSKARHMSNEALLDALDHHVVGDKTLSNEFSRWLDLWGNWKDPKSRMVY